MSRFTGPQYPGAMRDHRQAKREEAEARQELYRRRQEAAQIVDKHLNQNGDAA